MHLQLDSSNLVGLKKLLMIRCRRSRPRSKCCLLLFSLAFVSIMYRSTLFSRAKNILFPPSCETLCSYSTNVTHRYLYFDRDHLVRHFPNFVCPQNFRNLADWVYGWPDQFDEHLDTSNDQIQLVASCLPPGSIIYVRIWDIDEFFKNIYPQLINDFVLITGEGDLSSPTHLEYLNHPQSKIIHWFGQNGQIHAGENTKFTHIPIGK